mmetsp:Transcript_13949/g.36649  ORF Transcript_13949/g.36649 Transcript_13949/m.36649 type:complete len:97 (-) Transcript_13949:213-503(-)
MVKKKAAKKPLIAKKRGGVSKPPRLKSAVDGVALDAEVHADGAVDDADFSMDTEGAEQGGKKGKKNHSKAKHKVVRKKRRVKVMGAKYKQRRKGIN